MRVTLLDLGIGNLHSLEKAFQRLPSTDVRETRDVAAALDTDLLVLPGVGAFSHAAAALAPAREELRRALEDGLPAIGICLGMQLLFDTSEEGPGSGIGYFEGPVTKLRVARAPHMGWSRVHSTAHARGPSLPDAVYYAHSFACRPADPSVVVAETRLAGETFPAVVRRGRVVGFQFHPEKSSNEGVALLLETAKELVR